MLVAKQTADLITTSRALMAIGLAWLGLAEGEAALPLVAWAMLLNWTGDSIDGALARRSRRQYHTWIGDHDLQVDMLVSAGLLVYLVASGFWGLWQAALYVFAWSLVFWRWGLVPALGMLFQAPIYAWFIYLVWRIVPVLGWLIILWIVCAIVVTWPRFPKMIVPGFLEGISQVFGRSGRSRSNGA